MLRILPNVVSQRPPEPSSLSVTSLSRLPSLLAEGGRRAVVLDTGDVGELPPPEITFTECTAQMLRSALLDRGYIVLRRAIPVGKLTHFRDAWVVPAIEHYARLSEADIAAMDPALTAEWWGAGNPPLMLHATCNTGSISNPMLKQATEQRASYFDLISDPNFHALLTLAFPSVPFVPSPVAHCRRIAPAEKEHRTGWADAVPFHCDLRYHRDGKFAINFWTPLEPAGPAYGSPTLQTINASLAATAKHLNYDPSSSALFDAAGFEIEALTKRFGKENFVVHDLAVGDVLAITNWTLHRTYVEPDMRNSRLSVEIRMTGDSTVTQTLTANAKQRPALRRWWWASPETRTR